MDGWMQIGDDGEKIPIEDIHIDHERQENIKFPDKVTLKPGKAEYEWSIDPSTMQDIIDSIHKIVEREAAVAQIRANGDHTCKKCKNLISILQEVNGEIMHCGYNCKKSSMRADSIKETKRCMFYERTIIL